MSDKLTREILKQLSEPFPAEVIQWKPSATWSKDGKSSALAVPFVDLRYYYDRLNDIVGGDWTDEIIPVGENRLIVRLTICDSTRSDVGESTGKGDNAFTTAYAQGFKRVCVHFGLGAHLYTGIPQTVVPYDPQRKRITREGFETLRQVVARAVQSGDHRPVEPPDEAESHAPPATQAAPAPAAASGNGADAGVVLPLKKAKELMGKDNPTIQDVAALGDEGHNYLRWIADNITDKPFADAVRRFLATPQQPAAQQAASPHHAVTTTINTPQALLEYANGQGKVFAGVALLYSALNLNRWPGAEEGEKWMDLVTRVNALPVPQ